MGPTDQRRAMATGIAAVLLWSTVATAFKLSLRHLDPVQLLLAASAVSTVALFGVLAATGRLGALRRLGRADLARSAGLGLLNPLAYYLVLFEAYARLPAQEAQPINYTWAITLTLLAAPTLGQRLRLPDLGAILLGYAGVFVIATRGDLLAFRISSPLGAGLALASTLLWSAYWILSVRDPLDPVVRLFVSFVVGTLGALAVTLSLGRPLPVDPLGLLGATYVGLFEMGLTFVLWLRALKLARSVASVTALIFFSPFLSLLLIHFVVGEPVLPSTLAGLGLVVAGLAVGRLGGARRSERDVTSGCR